MRRGIARKGVNDLLRRPFRRRVLGDIEVDDPSAVVREQHQDEQHATRQGWNGQEIRRYERPRVIREEVSPRLGWGTAQSPEDPRDGSLRELDPELRQLAMDLRRSPQRICHGHCRDKGSNRGVGRRRPG